MRVVKLSWMALFLCGGCIGEARLEEPSPRAALPDEEVDLDGLVCPDEWVPGPTLIRRLTNAEYAATVRELLPVQTDPARGLPEDGLLNGFDNAASVLSLSPLHVERLQASAERAVGEALGTSTGRAQVLGCDVVTDAKCAGRFVDRFGRRAFRRPLSAEESAAFRALATSLTSPTDPYFGVRAAAEAMLQSPHFLFRAEVGEPDAAHPGWHRLTDFELATRLAFLLWARGPDDALLDAAGAGQLASAEGLEAQARRLLADDRAKVTLRRFARLWLHLDRMSEVAPDPSRFPRFTDSLRQAMVEETLRAVDEAAWRPGADFLELLDSPTSFVNAELAALYQVPPPGSGFAPVTFPAQAKRSGILTHASILTLTSKPAETSVIHRGKFVRDVLMCDPLPPPPVVNTRVAALPGETPKQALARHVSDAACASCHQRLDPVGYGLEEYGPIGELRTVDTNAEPVDGKGSLFGLSQPDFQGAAGLAQKLRESGYASRCAVTQTYRFAYGRGESAEEDRCAIKRLNRAFVQSGRSYPELLLTLVKSEPFRFRREVQP